MTLDDEGLLLDALVGSHLNSGRLNDFERRFIADNEQRYLDAGPIIFLSGKQWRIINQIRDKVLGLR